MALLFTADEIQKVIAKMKPSKSPGCDEILVELIKYPPENIHQQIAEMYNIMTETGDTPGEIHTEFRNLFKSYIKEKAHHRTWDQLSSSSLSVKFSQYASSTESMIVSRQKHHPWKQFTDQIDQQLNTSSLLNNYGKNYHS